MRIRLVALLAVIGLALPSAETTILAGRAADQGTGQADPRIFKLLDAISAARLQALNEKLTSFETRNLMSNQTDQVHGIGASWQWIADEMKRSSPRLQVSFDIHKIPQGRRVPHDVELRNVMAVLPGKSARRVYISGHYDSINSSGGQAGAAAGQPAVPGAGTPDVLAPGGNDDGSGTVLTMELARVFAESGMDFDATLVFICLSGEEEDLDGAKAHAEKAKADGTTIDAVLNNDITGNSHGGDGTIDGSSLRIFSLGPEDSPSRQLARYIQRTAAVYVPGHTVRLIARQDRFGRGGDHEAFNDNGFAAVRISESKENYSRQHSARDTSDGVDFEYLAKNAKVNAAAAASLALAPPAPLTARPMPAPAAGGGGAAGAAAGGGRAGGAGAAANAGAGRQAGAATTAPPVAAGATAPAAGAAAGRGRAAGPGLSRGRGYDATLRWVASPGATGYRIFWRDGWSLDWQHELPVGAVTEYTFPNMSIDDFMFGVAAVGADGHESLVAAYLSR